MTAALELRPDEARRFLNALDPAPGAVFTFQTFDDSALKRADLAQVRNGPLLAHQGWLKKMSAAGAGVFVTVNETDGKGRKYQNVQRVRALFVDLDGAPLEPILAAPVQPQIIIESSPGRWHAYWLVDGCPLEKFRQYQQRLIELFHADKTIIDLPRVMRLPGFAHQKASAFVTRIERISDAPRYQIVELVRAFDLDKAPADPVKPRTLAPVAAGDDLIDDLAEALDYIDADEYKTWISVGLALKTLGDRALPLWHHYSSRSAKYKEALTDREWKTMAPSMTSYRDVFTRAQAAGWDAANAPSIQRKRAQRERPPLPSEDDFAQWNQGSAIEPANDDAGSNGGASVDDDQRKITVVDRSIPELVRRFELVHGTRNVWDCDAGLMMTHAAFVDLVGKDAAAQWKADPSKRQRLGVIKSGEKSKPDKAKKPKEISTKVDWMLPRYSLVYGTECVFDHDQRRELTLGALRAYCGLKAVRDWGDHPARKVVNEEQVTFDPRLSADDNTICNLWGGWPIEAQQGSDHDQLLVNRWLNVLHYVCGGEDADEVSAWVLKWIAYQLQHPGVKMKTSIVMHGPEGTGKNTVWDAIRRIFGRYGIQISQTQIESQYTDWISAKLFLVANEVLHRQEQVTQKGRVKMLITDSTLRVDRKWLPGRTELNCANIVFLSNVEQPLNLDPDDRRFLIIWTPPPHPDGKLFYDGLGEDSMPDSAVRALYWYLLQVDTSGFGAHTKPPMTEAKRDLIEASMPSHARFVRDWMAGMLPVPFCPCTAQDLYHAYQRFCSKSGDKFPKPINLFSVHAKKHVKSAVKWYLSGSSRRQATFWVPSCADPPDGVSEAIWLAGEMEAFKAGLKEYSSNTEPNG